MNKTINKFYVMAFNAYVMNKTINKFYVMNKTIKKTLCYEFNYYVMNKNNKQTVNQLLIEFKIVLFF